ncbi:carbohydrate esterase family 1 protein, partial [Collybiopsis luxurians FD-317 M1]
MFLFAFLWVAAILFVDVMPRPINSNLLTKRDSSSSDQIFSFDTSNHATRKITDGNFEGRSYLVHLPANYDNSKKHPVVVSFHGNGGTSAKQEKITQLSDQAMLINNIGIIAVYPQASLGKGRNGGTKKNSWQGAPYAADGVDDIGFVKQILDEITEHLAIDTKRIYATGKSNGGGFTNLLACTPSINTRIAAFATVSAALYPGTLPGVDTSDTSTACDPKRVIPILISHGYNDTTIPYEGQSERSGSKDYRTPNIDDFAKAWATRNAQYTSSSGSS